MKKTRKRKLSKKKKNLLQNRLQHTTTIYLHPEVALFASELTSRLPPGLDVAYFTNSGTEANDLAILLARAFTKNYDLLALRHAYHGGGGEAYGATAHSTWRHSVPAGLGVRHVACPDAYRGAFTSDEDEVDGIKKASRNLDDEKVKLGRRYARELQETIDTCTPGRVAGFLHESIQGVGGVRGGGGFGFRFFFSRKRKRKRREYERRRRAHLSFFLSFFPLSLSITQSKRPSPWPRAS
jgi:4-aminobutyrate aminotransferase-like enzyme